MKKIFYLLLSLLIFNSFLPKAIAGLGDNVFGFAWSENIGWISFNNCRSPTSSSCSLINYGVNIRQDGTLEGYAWSENIGWISFNQSDLTGCPIAPCKAWVDLQNRRVYGWAKVLSAGGGWDGWIRLRDSLYGLSISTTSNPNIKEFEGWAWSDMVVGWISFNCKNRNSCSTSNYKVYTTFNFPPNPPTNLTENINRCAWETSPQVAPGLSITFNWNYSDLENNPQQKYEIWISDGIRSATTTKTSNFPSYTLDLNDFGNWRNFQCSHSNFGLGQDNKGLCWNRTYYWRVRVQDSIGGWSDWSITKSFTTPPKPAPYPNFSFTPATPTALEVVSFQDLSICYGPSTPGGSTGPTTTCSSWLWTFLPDGNPQSSTAQNPTTTFQSRGTKTVTLNAGDGSFSCQKQKAINVLLPLPFWKEIIPFISSIFKPEFFLLTSIVNFGKFLLDKIF